VLKSRMIAALTIAAALALLPATAASAASDPGAGPDSVVVNSVMTVTDIREDVATANGYEVVRFARRVVRSCV
jgi:hypothetical protein